MSTTAEIIQSIQTNLSNAYTSLENKGATIPEKKNIENLASAIDSVPAGGGADIPSDSGGKYLVQVIDYDGLVLKQDHLDAGAIFTLPDTPTHHERLVFQEWVCPIEITNNTIIVDNQDIAIGAIYTTKSGLSEFDITLTKATGLTVTLNINGTKDWGDGTGDDSTSHTYTEYGDYMITCNGDEISNYGGIFNSTSKPNHYTRQIRLSPLTSLPNNCFYACHNLNAISISNGTTNIGSTVLKNCYSLKSIVIPSSANTSSLKSSSFQQCSNLEHVVIPSNTNLSLGDNVFNSCFSLKSVALPSNVILANNNIFSACYSLTSIKVPSAVTSIPPSFASYSYKLTKCDMTNVTTVPTLADTSAFSKINGLCKIYVPDELYDEWIVATNWATYANYIYKASEMEA